jgi:lysophospholipase L1-like esterase
MNKSKRTFLKLLSSAAVIVITLALPVDHITQAQTGTQAQWLTAWSMSPSSLPPGPDAEDTFNNQTLRQIARITASGDSIRLRISNTHGNKPLKIGALTVAAQADGSTIATSSLRNVTVNGQSGFVIPRGAVVMSDPVVFPVTVFDQLSISMYLPEGSGQGTVHRAAMQTAYVSAGDNTRAESSPTDSEEINFWYFLSAIDVLTDEYSSTIVTLGDSITDGVGSTVNANQRWPDIFAERLQAEQGMPRYAIANAGISGNRVLHERNSNFGENLLARFERDVLALSGVSHIVLLEGINDIGMAAAMATDQEVSAEQIVGGYMQGIQRAKARGIKVIGATLTPYEGAAYHRPEGEAKRQQVNNWIRSSGAFDALIDFERSVQDATNPRRLPANFTADNLHPNDIGYQAMANSIDLSIFK